jgi:hypothetical protein
VYVATLVAFLLLVLYDEHNRRYSFALHLVASANPYTCNSTLLLPLRPPAWATIDTINFKRPGQLVSVRYLSLFASTKVTETIVRVLVLLKKRFVRDIVSKCHAAPRTRMMPSAHMYVK